MHSPGDVCSIGAMIRIGVWISGVISGEPSSLVSFKTVFDELCGALSLTKVSSITGPQLIKANGPIIPSNKLLLSNLFQFLFVSLFSGRFNIF